jgi:hypothetical protein
MIQETPCLLIICKNIKIPDVKKNCIEELIWPSQSTEDS